MELFYCSIDRSMRKIFILNNKMSDSKQINNLNSHFGHRALKIQKSTFKNKNVRFCKHGNW